jgi:hypothetical protein
MRAAPAFQVTLRRFGVWQVSISMLVAAGLVCLGIWAWVRHLQIGWSFGTALGVCAACSVGLGISLCRIPPLNLRWDGVNWHLGDVPGELRAIIDLGPWMLLRFIAAEKRSTSTWVPAQRRGLELQWHAFRCSVYSPRPSRAAPAPDAAPAPATSSNRV